MMKMLRVLIQLGVISVPAMMASLVKEVLEHAKVYMWYNEHSCSSVRESLPFSLSQLYSTPPFYAFLHLYAILDRCVYLDIMI